MAIAQSTTIQAYQLNKGGSPARLAILRMIAADSVNNFNESTRLQPGDWKGARDWTLKDYAAAYGSGIMQGGNDQWYSHSGEQFRNERDASDIVSLRHTGYYTDVHQEGLAIGIVASLSHNRFIAGYRWTDNDERVYFPEIFTDDDDAASMADEHARVFAESACEHSQRSEDAQTLQSEIETMQTRLLECLALRHKACMQYVRAEIQKLIESIRDKRQTLSTEYANYI